MEDKRDLQSLDLGALKPYPGHIFAPYEGERFDGMVDSVKEHGVIAPIIVRKVGENEYQILSGHNRVNAAKAAGLTEIKAVVHEALKNDEAEFIVTETNFMQRSFADLKHSERARALKNHLESIQKSGSGSGFRSDLVKFLDDPTLFPVETRLDSLKKAGAQYALSKTTVFRYVRLAKLPMTLLTLVDSDRIPVRAALELSFLQEDEMNQLAAMLTENPKLHVTLKTGEKLREETGRLSKDKMTEILEGKLTVDTEKAKKKIRRLAMSTDMLDRLNRLTKNTSSALDSILRFYFNGLDSGEFTDVVSGLEVEGVDNNATEETMDTEDDENSTVEDSVGTDDIENGANENPTGEDA